MSDVWYCQKLSAINKTDIQVLVYINAFLWDNTLNTNIALRVPLPSTKSYCSLATSICNLCLTFIVSTRRIVYHAWLIKLMFCVSYTQRLPILYAIHPWQLQWRRRLFKSEGPARGTKAGELNAMRNFGFFDLEMACFGRLWGKKWGGQNGYFWKVRGPWPPGLPVPPPLSQSHTWWIAECRWLATCIT